LLQVAFSNTFIDMETVLTEEKTCQACRRPIRGRTDKKFCAEACRNNYNNRLKSESTNLVRNINNALGKNRRILEGLYNKNERLCKVSSVELLHSGFHFRYYTHQLITKREDVYYFCYDYGYLPLDNGNFLIVKRKEEYNR
jgi:predicted nucleic acid-binding Zn ribbon protein